jgi:hypothetical protein
MDVRAVVFKFAMSAPRDGGKSGGEKNCEGVNHFTRMSFTVSK